jgi:hypothetical protein
MVPASECPAEDLDNRGVNLRPVRHELGERRGRGAPGASGPGASLAAPTGEQRGAVPKTSTDGSWLPGSQSVFGYLDEQGWRLAPLAWHQKVAE